RAPEQIRFAAPTAGVASAASRLRGRSRPGADAARLRKSPLDVAVQDLEEARHDVVAAQSGHLRTVHEDRGDRFLEGARQPDPDVGVLALARPVHDAAHDRHAQLLAAGMVLTPERHLVAQITRDTAALFL